MLYSCITIIIVASLSSRMLCYIVASPSLGCSIGFAMGRSRGGILWWACSFSRIPAYPSFFFVSFWADLDCFSPQKENGMNTIYPATKKARETSYPVWLLSSETTFFFIDCKKQLIGFDWSRTQRKEWFSLHNDETWAREK